MPTRSSGSVRVTYPAFSREELIKQLRQGVHALTAEVPVKRAVLFGSWAAGHATAYSDIDVLLVYKGPERADAHALVRRHLRVRGLEPHIYIEAEAEAVQDTLDRMTSGGVWLPE